MDRKTFITAGLSLGLLSIPTSAYSTGLISYNKENNKYPNDITKLLYSYYEDKDNYGAGIWTNSHGPVNDISIDVQNGKIEVIMCKTWNRKPEGTAMIESIYSWRQFKNLTALMNYDKYQPYRKHIHYLLDECIKESKKAK